MKISRIRAYAIPFTIAGGPYRQSGGRVWSSIDSTVVEIATDAGLSGFGECCPYGANYSAAFTGGVRAALDILAPALIGMNPLDTRVISERLDQALLGHPYTKSAFDFACWDIFGKAAGMPVYRCLGGRATHAAPEGLPVSADTPENMRASIAAARKRGVRVFNCKIGNDPLEDIARTKEILADRQPGETFIMDANMGWRQDLAFQYLLGIDRSAVYVEQPCASYVECRDLYSRIPFRMSLDEIMETPADVMLALRDGIVSLMSIKVSRLGGLSKSCTVRELCLAAGVPISITDLGGSDIVGAALCHFALSTPEKFLVHSWDPRGHVEETLARSGVEISDGAMVCSEEPGLGLTVDPDVLGEPIYEITAS